MALNASEIAGHIEAELHGDGEVPIKGVAPVDSAQAGDIVLAENET